MASNLTKEEQQELAKFREGQPAALTMTLDEFVARGLCGKYSDGTAYGTPGFGRTAYKKGFAESAKRAKAAAGF